MRRQHDSRVIETGDALVQGVEKIFKPFFDPSTEIRPADGPFEKRVAAKQIAIRDQIANRARCVAGRGENANRSIPHR